MRRRWPQGVPEKVVRQIELALAHRELPGVIVHPVQVADEEAGFQPAGAGHVQIEKHHVGLPMIDSSGCERTASCMANDVSNSAACAGARLLSRCFRMISGVYAAQ